MTKEEYNQKKREESKRELLQGKLAAVDNLWSPQEDLKIYTLVGTKPRKLALVPKSSAAYDNYVFKNEPIEGSMVFYISRDAKGNPDGEPKKYLQLIRKGVKKDLL